MFVKELATANPKDVVTINSEQSVVEAMKLLLDNKISCLPVVCENNRLIGILSDKDIFKAAYKNQADFTEFNVGDLMSSEVIVGVADDDLEYISGLMTKNRIRHIPIVEEEKLVYLVSIGDIVKYRQKDMEIENRYLKQYIDGSYPA